MSKKPTVDGIFQDEIRDLPKTAREKEISAQEWALAAKRAKTSAAAVEDIEEWVVVVDDSPACLTILSGILKSLNMGVHPFRSASDALKHLQESDLYDYSKIVGVFSEIELPELHGLDFLREIRAHERTRELPFVAVTDVKDKNIVTQLAASGIQGFVVKPFKEQAIIDRVMALNIEKQKKLANLTK